MTTRIDAPSNPRIAAAVKAAASGASMLLEGRRMIEDALDAELFQLLHHALHRPIGFQEDLTKGLLLAQTFWLETSQTPASAWNA